MINMQEFEIQVLNSQGEQQEIAYAGNAPDLSELPSGSYTISFRCGEDMFTDRLVK